MRNVTRIWSIMEIAVVTAMMVMVTSCLHEPPVPFEPEERGWHWWEESHQVGVHNLRMYGIGSGKSKHEADADALHNLAGYLGTTVRSRIESITRATKQKVSLSYYESVDIVANRDFYGVLYEHHYHKGRKMWYSLAYVQPEPVDISICIDERVNGAIATNGSVRSRLKNDLTQRGYTLKYLPIRYEKAVSGADVNPPTGAVDEVASKQLSRIMILGTASTAVRAFDDPTGSVHTKGWKTAECRLSIDIVDTRSLKIVRSLSALGTGTHRQESRAVDAALAKAYKNISTELFAGLGKPGGSHKGVSETPKASVPDR